MGLEVDFVAVTVGMNRGEMGRSLGTTRGMGNVVAR